MNRMTDFRPQIEGVEVIAEFPANYAAILSPKALDFVAKLEREFGPRRLSLLEERARRQVQIDAGFPPDFLEETRQVREDSTWRVASTPADLQRRWVELTGPTDRKMMINALNSGADVFMADFEDANSPTWSNMVEGQINLRDAVGGVIEYVGPDGKPYRLDEHTSVLVVRPRGWHLIEKHVLVDDRPVSAALFDFGLFFFHNARKLLEKGTGPYFYLPKLENHLEARLWNDVFQVAQDELGIPRGTIRATVLIETVLAAFEMDEILYELREHAAGLNAGRWDYIFSVLKKFRNQPDFLLPDRIQVTMTAPFMRSYTELLVKTCHRRGAHAMGGMAAYIPNRKDPEANEKAIAAVHADKVREAGDGFDGTWVAHPDLVPVAHQVFQEYLGEKPNQKERQRPDVQVSARDLTDFHVPNGQITEAGVRTNISVGLLYLESWLRGNGAVAIYNLMEDTATAEISRAQLWQWLHSPRAALPDGRRVSADLYFQWVPQELEKIRSLLTPEVFAAASGFKEAQEIFGRLVTADRFIDFLTLVAYDHLE
jgi:malate synthase